MVVIDVRTHRTVVVPAQAFSTFLLITRVPHSCVSDAVMSDV